jgi:hypothetical protein
MSRYRRHVYWRLPRYRRIRLEWKPEDLWVGLYWRYGDGRSVSCEHNIWLCIVPTLPIHITYWHEAEEGKRQRLVREANNRVSLLR